MCPLSLLHPLRPPQAEATGDAALPDIEFTMKDILAQPGVRAYAVFNESGEWSHAPFSAVTPYSRVIMY